MRGPLPVLAFVVFIAACPRTATDGSAVDGGPDGGRATRVLQGSGTLTPAGASLLSDDGRVTVTFPANAVVAPSHVSIRRTPPAGVLDGSFPDGVAYDVDAPAGVAANVVYRFTAAELRDAQQLLRTEDGGLLVFPAPGDGGFPGPALPFHIPLIQGVGPADAGVFLAGGDSIADTEGGGLGSVVLTAQVLPVTSLGGMLSPVRIGMANTPGDCCTQAPWPMALPVGSEPASYDFYVQTPASVPRYYVDQIRERVTAFPPDFAALVDVRNQLDIVPLGPSTTKWDWFTLACNADGWGRLVFECQGFWSSGPASVRGQVGHARLSVPYACGAAVPPAASVDGGFGARLHGSGTAFQSGTELISDDGRMVVTFPPNALDGPAPVAITRLTQDTPAAYAVTMEPAGRTATGTVLYQFSKEEMTRAAGALTYPSTTDAGSPGDGMAVHIIRMQRVDADGGTRVLSGVTGIDEETVTVSVDMDLPAGRVEARVAPVRIGVEAGASPWPIRLVVGAPPAAYAFSWRNAAEGTEHTAAFVTLGTAPDGRITLTEAEDDFGPGQAALLPGATLRRGFLLQCNAEGAGAVTVDTSGGESPFTEADWDFVKFSVPVTCVGR